MKLRKVFLSEKSYKKTASLLSAGILAVCFFTLGAGLRNLFSVILQADMVYYKLQINRTPVSYTWCLAGLLPLFLLFLHKDLPKNLIRWSRAALPLLFLLPLIFFLGHNYFSMPLTLLILGWTTFRFGCLYGGTLRKIFRHDRLNSQTETAGPWIVSILYAGAVCWGFYMQNHAYRSFFLCYADWGIYADAYMKLAYAGGNIGNWLSSGLHWNPGINLLMALLMKTCPLPEFIFLFNSAIIYSAAPLAYLLCRKRNLSCGYAIFFAVAAILNPVFSNQSLSLFYGFHPINFMIPLLLCFFLFRETGNKAGMGIVFALSLLVQETVFIFWIGYGIYLLFRKRWIPGTALILFSISVFALLISVVLPHLVGTHTYSLTSFYERLGKTPSEIALSPVLHPGNFWTACFQWQNFAFLLTLLTPFFFCIWLFPAMLIAVGPLLAGVCLRNSAEIKNVVLWYGVEATSLFLALSIINLRRILDGNHSALPGLLNLGLKKKFTRRTLAGAAVAATVITVLGSYCCFGMTAYLGKYNYRRIAELPDNSALIREIKEKIPPESRVLTNQRLRSHFLFEYPVENFSVPRKAGDILVLGLHDLKIDSPEDMERLRREIAADRSIVPILASSCDNKQFVVFQVMPQPVPPSAAGLPEMRFQDFNKIGFPLPVGDSHFAGRCLYADGKYSFFFQIRKTPPYDIDIKVVITGKSDVATRIYPFGFGLFPAYSRKPGAVFMFEVPSPEAKEISVQFIKRPFSEVPCVKK